jgi:hypothetical protein
LTAPAPATAPGRQFALLAGAVTLAHIALLQWTPPRVEAPSPLAKTFTTRKIEVSGSAGAGAPASPAPPQAAPERPPPPRALPALAPAPAAIAAAPAPAEAAPPVPPPAAAAVEAPAAQEPAASTAAEPAAGPVRAALAIPGSVRLKYDVNSTAKGMTYTANAELLWLHDGTRYDARLEVGAAIGRSRVQTSSGRLTSAGLSPTRFSDKFRSEVAAHFDHEKGRITFSGNKDPATLEAGAQDRLSVFLQLSALLAGDPGRYLPGTEIPLQAVGANLAEPWIFKVMEVENVRLADREIPSLKLIRSPRHTYDTRAELWFAPSLDYLPARIRLTLHNGDSLDQVLRSADKP